MIDLDWIRELIDLVDESGIDTLEVSRFATRVRISKSPPVADGGGRAGVARSASPAAANVPSPRAVPAAEEAGGDGEAATEKAASEEGEAPPTSDLYEVSSPMVGTFYRAPAPDAPPYVETGERVQKGQTICILEAMKLMNELESEVSGVIEEICVENAEPVEYGQVLFRIDTSA